MSGLSAQKPATLPISSQALPAVQGKPSHVPPPGNALKPTQLTNSLNSGLSQMDTRANAAGNADRRPPLASSTEFYRMLAQVSTPPTWDSFKTGMLGRTLSRRPTPACDATSNCARPRLEPSTAVPCPPPGDNARRCAAAAPLPDRLGRPPQLGPINTFGIDPHRVRCVRKFWQAKEIEAMIAASRPANVPVDGCSSPVPRSLIDAMREKRLQVSERPRLECLLRGHLPKRLVDFQQSRPHPLKRELRPSGLYNRYAARGAAEGVQATVSDENPTPRAAPARPVHKAERVRQLVQPTTVHPSPPSVGALPLPSDPPPCRRPHPMPAPAAQAPASVTERCRILMAGRGTDLAKLPLDDLIRKRDEFHALLHSRERAFEQPSSHRDDLRTLVHGMTLEAMRRAGHWNDGTADVIVPAVVHADLWPEGKALRVLDYEGNMLHRFDSSGDSWVPLSSAGHSLPPEATASEILLIRKKNHYQWIDPKAGRVRDVPGDGDCFFSSIAGALGIPEAERATFNLALRASVARYIEADPTRLDIASTPDTP